MIGYGLKWSVLQAKLTKLDGQFRLVSETLCLSDKTDWRYGCFCFTQKLPTNEFNIAT